MILGRRLLDATDEGFRYRHSPSRLTMTDVVQG